MDKNEENKLMIILSHISPLCGLAIIVPLIFYLVKKDDSPEVAEHAKEALNFQISITLYLLISIPLVMIIIGLPIFFGIWIGSIILCIIAAIKASDGILYQYPLTIRFIK